MQPKRYCTYCGRVAHRCKCADENSDLRQFIARSQDSGEYIARWRETPYKRGVPPQIKRRERTTLRRNYAVWYAALVEQYGESCTNCGLTPQETRLVIDHILPIARGGLSEIRNLQLLCAECNRIKGKLAIDRRSDTNPT